MADPRPRRMEALRIIASVAGRTEPTHRRRGHVLHIDLVGPIGHTGGFNAAGVQSILARHTTAKEIIVEIDSEGGVVDEAIAIVNSLRKHPATVETTAGDHCMSAATLILAAGDRRYAYPWSRILLHSCELHPGAEARRWTAERFRQTAAATARMDQRMIAIYRAAGMRRTFIEAELRTEAALSLMTAELEGLIHGLVGGASAFDAINYPKHGRRA